MYGSIPKNCLYEYGVVTIKKYREGIYKICRNKVMRKAGYIQAEASSDSAAPDPAAPDPVSSDPEEKKLLCNLIRAKNTIFDICYCNDFKYFCTFTIDPAKYDRFNLKVFYHDFSKWINNLKQKFGRQYFSYILVPEQHKSGAWHLHGLFNDFPNRSA